MVQMTYHYGKTKKNNHLFIRHSMLRILLSELNVALACFTGDSVPNLDNFFHSIRKPWVILLQPPVIFVGVEHSGNGCLVTKRLIKLPPVADNQAPT